MKGYMMDIEVFGNKLIVKADEKRDKSPGGLVIPANVVDKESPRGVVVAAGPGLVIDVDKTVPNCIKVGDRVLYRQVRWDIQYEGVLYAVLAETDVIGVLPPVEDEVETPDSSDEVAPEMEFDADRKAE
jgi:chaperonin GroES